jgi:serine/threonine protein kinase/Flp pilus assembly protein TadD
MTKLQELVSASGLSGEQTARVLRVLEGYLAELEGGAPPHRDELLARHPDLAELLAEYLDKLDQLHEAAAGLRASPDGEELPLAPPEVCGRLGDFDIRREVGRGGMGVVYEAEQVSLGRRVALKVLPFAATMDPRQLQRFHNEARAAAGLHHTNIVPVFGVGCERGVHYYAMQFIDGRTLADLIAQQRGGQPSQVPTVPEAEGVASAPTVPVAARATSAAPRDAAYFRRAAEWGIQAAEALDCAHSLGVVHRDVKPANLLVDGSGRLWVTDFGLAQVQSDARLTMTGDLVGTLRYMSPEQALAKRVVIDHRTDVYSLGATLYELLTLQPAFTGSDRQELLRQIAFEEPRPPRRVNKAIPAELETIVLKALEKNPTDRYATAQELADDLERYLRDEPIRARRPNLARRARKWARRHRAAVMAAAVCLLVTLPALGWVLGDRAARQRESENKVREAMAAAEPGLRDGNPWDPALIAAAQRAEAQLGLGVLGPELHECAEQLVRDQHMLAQLENAHLQQVLIVDEPPDWSGLDELYAHAFAEYRLGVTTEDQQEVARRVRVSAIRTLLVVALEEWASVKDRLQRGAGASLRAVAELADDDPWRQRLRAAAGRMDGVALEGLAKEQDALRQPLVTLVRLAGALEHAGNRATAERLLQQAQVSHPADAWINSLLAMMLHGKKPPDMAAASRFYQAALALRPQSVALYHNLGLALREQGKLMEAEAVCRKAIDLKPDYAKAHVDLGDALICQGKLAEAEAACRKAIDLEPNYARAHCSLGYALHDQGKLAEAEAACRKAIDLKPDYAMAYCNLGSTLGRQGRLAEAEAACRKAIDLDPDCAEAHDNLGAFLCQRGDVDGAIVEGREAIRLKQDFARARGNLGVALVRRGDVDAAIAEFRKSISLSPDNPTGHYLLGNALTLKNELDGAIAEHREAIRLKKDFPEAHCNLGHILRDRGQFAEALTSLRRGHELGSKDPRWSYPSAQWV